MSRSDFELKTPEQIKLMRTAGLATAAALAAVKQAIRPGISTLELDAVANAAIVRAGGRSNFQLVPGYEHTICASINDEVVHGIPAADRILQAGDLISVDAGAEINGWNGDSAMTFLVPGGSDESKNAARQLLSDVTEQSLWVGIAALSRADHLNEVGVAIEDYIYSQGDYGILEDYVGHGIGRSMHEDPPVFNYRVRDQGPAVTPGLVVAIEPMVTAGSARVKTQKDGWTVSTKDHKDASHWEHTVAVHTGGIWVLTSPDGGKEKLAPLGVTPVAL